MSKSRQTRPTPHFANLGSWWVRPGDRLRWQVVRQFHYEQSSCRRMVASYELHGWPGERLGDRHANLRVTVPAQPYVLFLSQARFLASFVLAAPIP